VTPENQALIHGLKTGCHSRLINVRAAHTHVSFIRINEPHVGMPAANLNVLHPAVLNVRHHVSAVALIMLNRELAEITNLEREEDVPPDVV